MNITRSSDRHAQFFLPRVLLGEALTAFDLRYLVNRCDLTLEGTPPRSSRINKRASGEDRRSYFTGPVEYHRKPTCL